MLHDVIISLCVNVSILIVLAFMLTKFEFIKVILLNRNDLENNQGKRTIIRNQVILGLILGAFCMLSDEIGMRVEGAIPNSRVIGILSAGFIGGPVSGMLTAIIASLHRFIVFPNRASTFSCVLSSGIHGMIGSVVGLKNKNRVSYSNRMLFGYTFVAGFIHLVMVVLFTKPISAAAEITTYVMTPMMVINAFGMVIFFDVFKEVFANEDREVAESLSLSLRVIEKCVPFLGEAVLSRQNAQEIVNVIMSAEGCSGAAIVRDNEFLGASTAFSGIVITEQNYPRLLTDAKSYRNTRASNMPIPEDGFYLLYAEHLIVAAPIDRNENEFLTLVLLFRKHGYTNRKAIAFTGGLARFMAAQMHVADIEAQKEKVRRAEYMALQSQINPHFMFNALNTISYFCREKPEKARELILALSSYFRNMLNEVDKCVTLSTEIEQVRSYVMLEEARFEERLHVTIEAKPDDCLVRVPNLILQPLVENAIRHGAMKSESGVGEVYIRVKRGEVDTQIDIMDNGPGVPQAVIEKLYKRLDEEGKELSNLGFGSGRNGIEMEVTDMQAPAHGNGIGMRNVQQRMIALYGKEHGLQVISGKNGTTIRMVFPNDWK